MNIESTKILEKMYKDVKPDDVFLTYPVRHVFLCTLLHPSSYSVYRQPNGNLIIGTHSTNNFEFCNHSSYIYMGTATQRIRIIPQNIPTEVINEIKRIYKEAGHYYKWGGKTMYGK